MREKIQTEATAQTQSDTQIVNDPILDQIIKCNSDVDRIDLILQQTEVTDLHRLVRWIRHLDFEYSKKKVVKELTSQEINANMLLPALSLYLDRLEFI